MRVLSVLLLLCATSVAVAHDHETVVYDQVDLSANAEQEVANDLFVAVLYTEHEGQRQAEVAERVNAAMSWALEQAKPAAGIKAQTLQYSTYPVYASDSTRVTGWRARQSLRLEGRDAKAIGELVATLQEKLAVESVGQAVSREARRAAEDGLTATALAQFDARAKQIAAALGRSGYRLVRINVSSTGNPGMPIAYRGAMMAEAAMKAAPVQVEAGEQTLGIAVSGTIQLDPAR
ncbi:MAG: SIMPL domain-containing protein [Gammaproteobacteria bacterium]